MFHKFFYHAHLHRLRIERPPEMMLLVKTTSRKEATDGSSYALEA